MMGDLNPSTCSSGLRALYRSSRSGYGPTSVSRYLGGWQSAGDKAGQESEALIIGELLVDKSRTTGP